MDKRNEVISELQMLTGISSKDVTVLYYNLVKDGTYFDKEEIPNLEQEGLTMEPFDEWLQKLEEIEWK